MVCLLGQTVARELFDEQSPIGQEVYVNDVPLRVIGVLARKGADIIGEDQDDLLRRALDDGQVPGERGGGVAPAKRRTLPRRIATALLGPTARRYPRRHAAPFPAISTIQSIDTPRLERLSNVDSIMVRALSTEEIPAAMEQITRVLRERHRSVWNSPTISLFATSPRSSMPSREPWAWSRACSSASP